MTVIVNGEPNRTEFRDAFDPPDRAIKLPNITIELRRTPEGGWIAVSTSHQDPSGGGGTGHDLYHLAKFHPWIVEQLWRRIIEVEDELRTLRRAISYKES